MPDAIGTTRASYVTVPRPPARQDAVKGPPRSVARLLGMTPYEVNRELRRGRSLDDLANERGVPHDELINAILGGREGGPKEKRMAERLASMKFPPPLTDDERDESEMRTVRRRYAAESGPETTHGATAGRTGAGRTGAEQEAAERKGLTTGPRPVTFPARLGPQAKGSQVDLAL